MYVNYSIVFKNDIVLIPVSTPKICLVIDRSHVCSRSHYIIVIEVVKNFTFLFKSFLTNMNVYD